MQMLPGVEVIFENVMNPGGIIRIKDDGHGMTIDDFRDRWMIVGTESKERQSTSRKGRRMLERTTYLEMNKTEFWSVNSE